ncbi:MAG: NUDIX hydrolase [Hymenobacteraceae bacterium]|nr:NUDIX hydrolase [Hymenobacteraceae bacterium]
MIVLETADMYKGHLKVRQITVQATPDAPRQHFEVVTRHDAVAALVFDPAARGYLLVEQWRVGAQGPVLELPAGLIDAGETPEAALRRELREEIGGEAGELTPIATFYTSPGFSTEQIHLFYAEFTERSGVGGGRAEEGEAISIRVVPADEFFAMPLADAKTLVAREWAKGNASEMINRSLS